MIQFQNKYRLRVRIVGFQLLCEKDIKTWIITSEETRIVADRRKKLQVDYLILGAKNIGKLEAAKVLCHKEGFSLHEVA